MRRRRVIAAVVAGAGLVVPVAARAAEPAGLPCRLTADVTELRSDVAAYHVSGGPFVVPGATSVTVTCDVLVDGATYASVGTTRQGAIGWTAGHVTVGTFSGPTIGVCTRVSWTDAAGTHAEDCPAG